MGLNHDNFAFDQPLKYSKNVEQYCLTCGAKYFTLAILGSDQVYRMLHGHCRKCCPICIDKVVSYSNRERDSQKENRTSEKNRMASNVSP